MTAKLNKQAEAALISRMGSAASDGSLLKIVKADENLLTDLKDKKLKKEKGRNTLNNQTAKAALKSQKNKIQLDQSVHSIKISKDALNLINQVD